MSRPRNKEERVRQTITIPVWLKDELVKYDVKNISIPCIEALKSLIPLAKARQEQTEKSLSIFAHIERVDKRKLQRIAYSEDIGAEEELLGGIRSETGHILTFEELHPMIISVLKGVKGEG